MLYALLGDFVNTAAILLGGAVGLLLKRGLSQRLADTLIKGVVLFSMYVGIVGMSEGDNLLLLALSIVIGTLIGHALGLHEKTQALGERMEARFQTSDGGRSTFTEGFISASLLFCVGSLGILGSLQSGLTGNHTLLYTKGMLDGITALLLASSLGAGVLLSGASVLVYQGLIVVFARLIAPFLSETVVGEMTAVGSILLLGQGLNMLKLTDLKILNYTPGIFLPILLCPLFAWLGTLF